MPTLYARAIRRAAEILGEAELAARLGVTDFQLEFWLRGLAVPPGDVFLKVADILGEHSLDELRHPRPESATDRDGARDETKKAPAADAKKPSAGDSCARLWPARR